MNRHAPYLPSIACPPCKLALKVLLDPSRVNWGPYNYKMFLNYILALSFYLLQFGASDLALRSSATPTQSTFPFNLFSWTKKYFQNIQKEKNICRRSSIKITLAFCIPQRWNIINHSLCNQETLCKGLYMILLGTIKTFSVLLKALKGA